MSLDSGDINPAKRVAELLLPWSYWRLSWVYDLNGYQEQQEASILLFLFLFGSAH